MRADFLPRQDPRVEVDDATPVFIAGADRSGTTLMFALLASHPDLCMVRRTNMWRYFYRRYGDLGHRQNLDRCLDDMLRYRRMRHLAPDPARIRREFLSGTPSYGNLFALFHQHNAERAGKHRWGDKSLHTEHFAKGVFTEFPAARVVHLVRDPRDRYASVQRRNGKRISRVGAATGRWLMSTHAAQRNAEHYPDNYMIVRYEDLVQAPEATLRAVCSFAGLEYSGRMLSMEGMPQHRDAGGNSSFGDLEPGAISVKGIGRFREVLSRSDVAFIELAAGRALPRAGYERSNPRLNGLARTRYAAWEVPTNGLRMAVWMARARLRMRRGVPVPKFRLENR